MFPSDPREVESEEDDGKDGDDNFWRVDEGEAENQRETIIIDYGKSCIKPGELI